MIAPTFKVGGVSLFHGDCIDVMRELPDDSVHAVVTDPPYGIAFMGKAWDQPGEFGSKRSIGDNNRNKRRGAADDALEAGRYDLSAAALLNFQRWCEAWARECYRVLKPGGHLLSFGGSRTWHRLASGIEDAGFEMRDSIAWLYGSGFPKSLDVSKAIDKQREDVADVRAVCRWLRARIDEHPVLTVGAIADSFGFNSRMVDHWAARDSDSQPSLPTLAQWDSLREMLGFDTSIDAEVYRLNLRKGEPGEAWADREIVGTVEEWSDRTNYALTSRDGLRRGESKNPVAAAWQGWGTALKPSFEPIVVARKPLAGTVAANVLAHGTGALNIDASRVHTAGSEGVAYSVKRLKPGATLNETGGNWRPADEDAVRFEGRTKDGRWPANVLLDESQAAVLDEQTGVLTSGILSDHHARNPKVAGILGAYGSAEGERGYGDSSGPSRYFPTFRYEAKAPSSERPDQGGVQHPTVKPLDLMRWLVRLVTPPGGVVLEPFAGSGTTLEACVREGFDVIGIEREADYLPLIEQRLSKDHQQSLFGDWDGDAA